MKTLPGPARALGIFAAALLCTTTTAAPAQTFSIVHSFSSEGGSPYAGLAEGPDGRLYGTTAGGGLWGQGSVFVLDPAEGGGFTVETLYSFTGGYDGGNPRASLILANDGSFYGTTYYGDPQLSPGGTVFRVDTNGNLATLHVFFGYDDGYNPSGSLMQASDDNLYGVTQTAGGGSGTVFRCDLEGHVTVLHVFQGPDGVLPIGPLVEGPGGLLYGTTSAGGSFGGGTIYRVSFGGVFETLHHFDGPEGRNPAAGLIVGPDGNLWGTAKGGVAGWGTVFRSNLAGNDVEGFSFGSPDGDPSAPLVVAGDGDMYGTTTMAVFRVTTSGVLTTLHAFGVPGGFNLQGPLVQADDGLLYGTTVQGGDPNVNVFGTIFRFAPAGGAVETLASFGPAAVRNPWLALLQGADGNLYGTANGTYDLGTVYRVAPDGEAAMLHAFVGPDGRFPSGLVRTPDGRLFGSTYLGGAEEIGTVYEIDPSGTFTPFHDFTSAEGVSPQGLTLARDGSLWGALGNPPQVFRLGPTGDFTPVHGVDGDSPFGAMTETDDGVFIGATYGGGPTGLGTLFRVDSASQYATLHGFSGWDGGQPAGAPVLAPDGNLYGMTASGGAYNAGTIFRMSPGGRLKTIHDFAGADGMAPNAPLILGADGSLYGVTRFGGIYGRGNVFRVNGSGAVTNLHSFAVDDGQEPFSPLAQGMDGGLYGTTRQGGLFGGGVLFRVEPPPALAIWTLTPSSGPWNGLTTVTVEGSGFYFPSALFGSEPGTNVHVINQNAFTVTTPPLAPGTLNAIAVANSFDGRHGELADAWFADFLDVPQDDSFHGAVETVFREGITAGCGEGLYCRNDPARRDQMAVFLLLGEHGSGYAPPACIGVFADVLCPGPFTNWVEQLAAEGITAGCGGGNYCPAASVTRAQMAVLLLKTKHGAGFAPTPCAGIFEDVTCPGAFTDWIEQLYIDEVTGGCQASPLLYCPDGLATRGQMAVFVVRVFSLP